jgi:hypothetical protein
LFPRPIVLRRKLFTQAELTPTVAEFRLQSGFFSADGLPPFAQTLQRLASANMPIHVLIGSNNSDTLQADVDS